MARPKTKPAAVTVGEAKSPADPVKIQYVLPNELVQAVRKEAYRRASETGAMPSASDVVADYIRAGLAKKR